MVVLHVDQNFNSTSTLYHSYVNDFYPTDVLYDRKVCCCLFGVGEWTGRSRLRSRRIERLVFLRYGEFIYSTSLAMDVASYSSSSMRIRCQERETVSDIPIWRYQRIAHAYHHSSIR